MFLKKFLSQREYLNLINIAKSPSDKVQFALQLVIQIIYEHLLPFTITNTIFNYSLCE